MSILSVDNIQPIGSGTSVTVNSAATLVLNNVDSVGVATASNFKTGSSNLHSTGLTVGNNFLHSTGINVGTGATIHVPATNVLTLGTNSNERLRISSNGDMRLGGGTPSTFGSGTTVHETYNASTYTANLVTSGTHILQMIASQTHGATSIGTRSNHNLNLCANDSTKMTITTDGRVGINTSTPQYPLHVAGHTTDASPDGIGVLMGLQHNHALIHLNAESDLGCIIDFSTPNTDRRGGILYYHSNNSTVANRDAMQFATAGAERLRITSGGDLLLGGHSDYTYDDTGDSNVILDIYGGATAGKRGILSLSGRTGSNNADLGTIWFNNDNNSGASPGNNMKLAAAIQAKSVTSDSNAQNDSGAYLQFFTKAESGSVTERLRISSQGYVTKPAHPSFYVRRSIAGDGRSAATPITEWSSTYANGAHNQGSHFNTSTGLFTAPVSGIYHFSAAGGYKQASNNFNQKFRLNSTLIAEGTRMINYPDAHSTATISATVYMAAGNTMSLAIETTHHVNTSLNFFSGHLVG